MTPEMITAAAKAASVLTADTVISAERRRIAEDLRDLAANGADPEKLAAYADALETRSSPPFIDLAQRTRREKLDHEGLR